MHYRKPAGLESSEIGLRDAAVVAPLVACIVGLALYPGLILGRSDAAVKDKIAAVSTRALSSPGTPATSVRAALPDGAFLAHSASNAPNGRTTPLHPAPSRAR
jgi:hypothetical protein